MNRSYNNGYVSSSSFFVASRQSFFGHGIVFGIQEHNFMHNINLQLLELSIGRPIGPYIFHVY
jgi:hypothetical protein